ncbi:hypothetical protein GGS20DRAFT_580642 [Poronia punctata]|nr:hypothetical protein GGS20DRAFT_580642 [Poronia punctata]
MAPTAYSSEATSGCDIMIHSLPADFDESQVRLLLLFSQEVASFRILPPEPEGPNYSAARVTFNTLAGARNAKEKLGGKVVHDAKLRVEIISGESTTSGRYPAEAASPTQNSGSTFLPSPTTTARAPPQFGHKAYKAFDRANIPQAGNVLPEAAYQYIFSPTSPIGGHLPNRAHASGKSLIHDTAGDDDTPQILNEIVSFGENGATPQRRATAPQIPSRVNNMQPLNLDTTGTSVVGPAPYPGISMSPSNNTPYPQGPYRQNLPPANPADQNPPCNTLYVGNLPIDTSEEELKAVFSKARGYKRLCFRTKQNGPMCFVEFEDVSHATRALHELYGQVLHNSTKGGIRLSFSKNPLGVRNNQNTGPPANGAMANMNGVLANPAYGYPIANGPPPGLSAPPGLNRGTFAGHGRPPMTTNGVNTPPGYSGNNPHVWNNPQVPYNGAYNGAYNGTHNGAYNASPNGAYSDGSPELPGTSSNGDQNRIFNPAYNNGNNGLPYNNGSNGPPYHNGHNGR